MGFGAHEYEEVDPSLEEPECQPGDIDNWMGPESDDTGADGLEAKIDEEISTRYSLDGAPCNTMSREEMPAEDTRATIVEVGGAACRLSSISSGLVYIESDNVTPDQDAENRRTIIELQRELREHGYSPSDEELEQIYIAQGALMNYVEGCLGVPVGDRMLGAEQYRFFDDRDKLAEAYGRDPGSVTAVIKNGVGVLVNRSLIDGAGERLHLLTHETAHLLCRVAIHPSLRFSTEPFWVPYAVEWESYRGAKTGIMESAIDLAAIRSLDDQGIRPSGDPPSSYNPVNALLHGVIEKMAATQDSHPCRVADEIAKGVFTGDISFMQDLVRSLGVYDQHFVVVTSRESFDGVLTLADRLNLPATVNMINNRHKGSLSQLFRWR